MSTFLVKASTLQGYRRTVQDLGGHPEDLMARHGLADADRDLDAWLPYRDYLNLMEHTADATGCPTFGLRMSTHQDMQSLGTVGLILQQAPDVRSAMRSLNRYFNHINQGAVTSTEVVDDVANWTFTARPMLGAPIIQQSDLVAGSALNIMRTLVIDWKPVAIYLPHSAPANTRPYKRMFQCPVFFNWNATIVAGTAASLDLALEQANPHLHRFLDHHLSAMRVTLPEDIRDRVTYLIKEALMIGDCSIEQVASLMAVNKRTLQRRLKSSGCSYQELLDDVRFDMACEYLRESTGSLSNLASMLCYSGLSTFSTAFRKRFGVSPREWRQRCGPGAFLN